MELDQEFDAAISLRKIKQHPQNPRRGDDAAVGESIDANGFFGAVLVQRSTGHILAGNTRWRAMRKRKAKTLPGFWIECDDETALRILLADNRTSDLATYDDAVLRDLLVELEQQAGLIGTGYTNADLAALLVAQEANLGIGAGERDDDTDDELSSGDLLALAEVTLGEPGHTVTAGQRWLLSGRHVLIVCDLMREWTLWSKVLLEHDPADTVFIPYPGVYVANTAVDVTMVMVQPSRFLAGHVLDKWAAVHGDAAVLLL